MFVKYSTALYYIVDEMHSSFGILYIIKWSDGIGYMHYVYIIYRMFVKYSTALYYIVDEMHSSFGILYIIKWSDGIGYMYNVYIIILTIS